MPVSQRQSILWTIVAIFLVGNLVLAAVFWSSAANPAASLAATGALVAEPMLLALGLGLGRQPLKQRLLFAVGLSLIGASAYSLGVLLADRSMRSDLRLAAAIYLLFLAGGSGSTLLAGFFFRAHRFLAGVFTVEKQPSAPELQEPGPESPPGLPPTSGRPAVAAAEPAAGAVADDLPGASSLSSVAEPSTASVDLQFGIGYLIATTSVIAMMISVQRLLATISTTPSWSIIFLFGWTFFVYAVLATLVIATSLLTTRYRRSLGLLAIVYMLLAPLATLPIIGAGGELSIEPGHVINLYSFALGLAATLGLVAFILRRLGYRLRYGRL